MKRTKPNKIAYYVLLLVLLLVLIKHTIALPVPAGEFYGTITINDSNATAGTNVTAYDANNTLCGYFIVVNTGYYGLLSCNGDDIDTGIDEGALDFDQIAFYAYGKRAVAFGNDTWLSGEFRFVNLSVKNYPPFFEHNLTTQYVNESSTLIYDVNCSDLNIDDNLTYYDNSSKFNISSLTGIINWIPDNYDVGNNTILITCSDGLLNTSASLTIIVYDVQFPPVLDSIGPLIAVEGELFVYDVNATDPDNDTLTYSTNSTLFTIDAGTGLISFTPSLAQIGNYSINISVSDGLFTVFEVILFRIVRGPYCGDGGCGAAEDCASCPQDCGSCPSVPPEKGGVSGKGAVISPIMVTRAACFEKWECTEWTVCSIEGFQTRTCIELNKCNTEKNKPVELRRCEYIPTCDDGIKNSDETGVDCGGSCPPCHVPASCSDKIQNQGEEDIDCGGPCPPCKAVVKEYPEIPLPKLAPLLKKFPWLLLLIVSILLSTIAAGDKIYVKRISRKEFKEYREKLGEYRKIRKRIYIAAIIFSFIGLVFILYLYFMSDRPELIEKFVWLPIIFIIVSLTAAFFIIRYFKYYEYKKRKKEQLLFLEEKKRKKQLIKMEDKLLVSLESKITDKISTLLRQDAFKEKELLNQIKDSSSILKELVEKRKEKIKPLIVKAEIKTLISNLSASLDLAGLAKDYPEFKETLTALKGLKTKEIEKIERFLLSIVDIARDKLLLSVIKSSEPLMHLYNKLVDVYESYKEQLESKEKLEENLIKKEDAFLRKIEDMTKEKTIETISENATYASVYNSMVDLYNHYRKRKELRNLLLQMERAGE